MIAICPADRRSPDEAELEPEAEGFGKLTAAGVPGALIAPESGRHHDEQRNNSETAEQHGEAAYPGLGNQ